MSEITAEVRTRLAEWQVARPTIALMGEFSAGKSTLLNALVATDLLPTRATATRMPAVWLTFGAARAVTGLRHDGTLASLDDAALAHGTLDDYLALRIADPAAALKDYDIVDTPGISDIRLQSGVIATLAGHVDLVVWCSSATQFWRQSEKAMWRSLPRSLRAHSILAVTGADRVTSRDLSRVLKRGRKEAKGLFADVLPVATLGAVAASADRASPGWAESGAAALAARIEAGIADLDRPLATSAIVVDAAAPPDPSPIEPAQFDIDANAGDKICRILKNGIDEISEISTDFQISTLLEQFLAIVDREKSVSDDRKDLMKRILTIDDMNGANDADDLRQIDGELSDFAEGHWCRLG